jgi:UDP-glucose 4-epimerase
MRASLNAGVKTFVYPGTILVYGSQSKSINQQTNPAPVTDYGRANLDDCLSFHWRPSLLDTH